MTKEPRLIRFSPKERFKIESLAKQDGISFREMVKMLVFDYGIPLFEEDTAPSPISEDEEESESAEELEAERLSSLEDLKESINLEDLKESIKQEITKEVQEQLRAEIKAESDDEWMHGFLAGARANGLCPRCLKSPIQSVHHILPRGNGGLSEPHNLIPLCESCHNEVEIKTDEYIKRTGISSTERFKQFILLGFPEIKEETKE